MSNCEAEHPRVFASTKMGKLLYLKATEIAAVTNPRVHYDTNRDLVVEPTKYNIELSLQKDEERKSLLSCLESDMQDMIDALPLEPEKPEKIIDPNNFSYLEIDDVDQMNEIEFKSPDLDPFADFIEGLDF